MSRLESWCRYCNRATAAPEVLVCGFCVHTLHREITAHLARERQEH